MASTITVQSHTINPAGDMDFISFSAISEVPCLIETSKLTSKCDTYIYLYDTNRASVIDKDNDSGESLNEDSMGTCFNRHILYPGN